MPKIIKARVLTGRYAQEIVRISNIALDERGRQTAACLLSNGQRANIKVSELELIEEEIPPTPKPRAKSASMPFVSGAASSRTLTQTKNMEKGYKKPMANVLKEDMAICEKCGSLYNREERKSETGKLTECGQCEEDS